MKETNKVPAESTEAVQPTAEQANETDATAKLIAELEAKAQANLDLAK